MPETSTIPIIKQNNPRKNLPYNLSSKRTENNFVLAFARSFVEEVKNSAVVIARELHLNGYGIADLVCILEHDSKNQSCSSKKKKHLNPFFAFEVKMKDWRGALAQAIKYKYYANLSIIVLPLKDADVAKRYIHTFKVIGIGLWAFEIQEKKIIKIYTPSYNKPLSITANQRALSSLSKNKIITQQFV